MDKKTVLDRLREKKEKIALQIKDHRKILRENEKRQYRVVQELETLDSLASILKAFRRQVALIQEWDTIRPLLDTMPDHPVLHRLFPKKERLIPRNAALTRIDAYLCQLAAGQLRVKKKLSTIDEYHQVLAEISEIHDQLKSSAYEKIKTRMEQDKIKAKKAALREKQKAAKEAKRQK